FFIGLGRCADALRPGRAGGGIHAMAQGLGGRQLGRVALFPGGQQVGEDLAMCLGGQLLQRMLGVFQRVALGAESRIAEARATVFERRTVAKTAAVASTIARAALVAAWLELVVAGARRTARAVLAV